MMDYVERDLKVNSCADEVVNSQNIRRNIQDTYTSLREMKSVLCDLFAIVGGNKIDDKGPDDASCLLEETLFVAELAHENLMRLVDIKSLII